MIRGIVIAIIYLTSLVVILFVSAGRIDWPMGWASLGIYILISIINFMLVDPTLVTERAQIRTGVNIRDMILASLSFLFFFPLTLLVAGLDIGRYAWSPTIPLAIQVIALLVFAFGNAIGSWAMVQNKYFSTFIRIQEDRDHEVITSGPYHWVRHPGYAGVILASIALPISLGSLWALIPAFIGACGFVVRTFFEDRVLLEELNGYREYAQSVPFRLLPGIW
ncbi:MAG: isoprenylcysteine carboxylmethyltransferase family protein [Anaerolineaceae bacterium]|nr:MAG: isoprenylcysteine carboxylmethyltransferase family protein [Anaerolineaceae bacterium]